MPRRRPHLAALSCLLFALAATHPVSRAIAEPGSPAELRRGQSDERGAGKALRGTRTQLLRDLSREQATELDSLESLAAVTPARAAELQREIERAKRRHAREEIALQHQVALRDGRVALARRLELRLARFDGATRGAR